MLKCDVEGCENVAVAEVILYDVYQNGKVFFEQDFGCEFICAAHIVENESKAKGVRQPQGSVEYPFTNQNHAQGFTIYRPLTND